jgi:hypothetical protein
MGKAFSFATVTASRKFCANGCGSRTYGNAICSECAKQDPEAGRLRRFQQRLLELKNYEASGAPIDGTCLSCLNWKDRCLMEIPEVSLAFAPKCACYLPVEVAA